MSTPRFVRGTKSRLFLYLGAVTIIGTVVYMFHGSQVELDEVRKKSDKCLQQQESLSAQLQVIFEYKLRLEKSLQQEKAEHRQTREELHGKADEEKQLRAKENLESINKYTSLQQQYKLLQSQHEDLNDECSKLRVTQLQGLEDRSKLEAAVQAVHLELEQLQSAKEKEMESLKTRYLQLENDNERLLKQNKDMSGHAQDTTSHMYHLEKENLQLKNEIEELKRSGKRCEMKLNEPSEFKLPSGAESPNDAVRNKVQSSQKPSSSPVAVIPPEDAHVLQEPEKQGAGDKASQSSQKSTTPQINPDAVMSREKTANVVPVPPPHEQDDKQPIESPVGARPAQKEASQNYQKLTTPQINPDAILSNEKTANQISPDTGLNLEKSANQIHVDPAAKYKKSTHKINPEAVLSHVKSTKENKAHPSMNYEKIAYRISPNSFPNHSKSPNQMIGVLSQPNISPVVPLALPQQRPHKLGYSFGERPAVKENEALQQYKESPQDVNGEGAVPAPQWANANMIPNQPAFNAIHGGLIENANNWNNQHQKFNIPAGVVPAPHGYGFHHAENVMHAPDHENINNAGNQENNAWPWRYNHWGPKPQPLGDLHNNIRLGDEENEIGDQHHDDLALKRDQNNYINRHNGQDSQRRRPMMPHRNAIGVHEENHMGGEEEKEIPRQLHNPYEYNGEYEKDRQRGDLQLEEGEEDEDDDMDQIDYANDGPNAAARPKHVNIKQPIVNMNKHDSVMVNPK